MLNLGHAYVVLPGDCWRGVTDCVAHDDPRSLRVIEQVNDPQETVRVIDNHLFPR